MALGAGRGEGTVAAVAVRSAMDELLLDVERDSEAYRAFLDARAGRGSLAAAVRGSIAVPRAVAERAAAALERLAGAWPDVRAALTSEAVTGAQALLASVEGAAFTAVANLAELDDAQERTRLRAELDGLARRARELAKRVLDRAGGQPA